MRKELFDQKKETGSTKFSYGLEAALDMFDEQGTKDGRKQYLILLSDGRPTHNTNPCVDGDHGSGVDEFGNPKALINGKPNPDLRTRLKNSDYHFILVLVGDVSRSTVGCLVEDPLKDIIILETWNNFEAFKLEGDLCIGDRTRAAMQESHGQGCVAFVGQPFLNRGRGQQKKSENNDNFEVTGKQGAELPCDCAKLCKKYDLWQFNPTAHPTCRCYKGATIKRNTERKETRDSAFGGPTAEAFCEPRTMQKARFSQYTRTTCRAY